jgi:hypothetical protein
VHELGLAPSTGKEPRPVLSLLVLRAVTIRLLRRPRSFSKCLLARSAPTRDGFLIWGICSNPEVPLATLESSPGTSASSRPLFPFFPHPTLKASGCTSVDTTVAWCSSKQFCAAAAARVGSAASSVALSSAWSTSSLVSPQSCNNMHSAVAQDLLECHEECERVSGHKAALAATVKQLGTRCSICSSFKMHAHVNSLQRESPQFSNGSERYYVQWHCWQG